MQDTEILESVHKGVEKGISDFGLTLDSKLAEWGEKLNPKPKDPAPGTVKMEQAGALENISRMEVWDIPLGQAAVGGFSAVFASELVDGFLIKQSTMVRGLVKAVMAGAVVKWGGRILGKTGAQAAAILLAYDAIRLFVPIDQWATRMATGVSGAVTTKGLGGNKETAFIQAQQVAADYYAKAEGR